MRATKVKGETLGVCPSCEALTDLDAWEELQTTECPDCGEPVPLDEIGEEIACPSCGTPAARQCPKCEATAPIDNWGEEGARYACPDCGELAEEPPEEEEVYECGECGERYVEREEAKECCRA